MQAALALDVDNNPDWVLGKVIGRGRFSDACLTWNNNKNSELYGKIYVRKQVHLSVMNKKDRRYARNEAGILAKFKDDNGHIVGIFESFENGDFFMLIEYCCGGDLDKRVKQAIADRTWFAEDLVMSWFCQISSALHLCHDRKIIHRDVKTKNIFLTKDDLVKLGDFGISREFETSMSMADTFVGTPSTISPEIFLRQQYSYKADIWSLGCVLFELLALRVPFPGQNIVEMGQLIVHTSPPNIPAHYSRDVADLVRLLLEKDPVKRPDIVQVLDLPFVRHHMSYAPQSAQKCMKRVDEILAARAAHPTSADFGDYSLSSMSGERGGEWSGFFDPRPAYSPADTYADSTVLSGPNTLTPNVIDDFMNLVDGGDLAPSVAGSSAADSKMGHDRLHAAPLMTGIGGDIGGGFPGGGDLYESKRHAANRRPDDVQCGGCSRRIPHSEAVASAGFCDRCRPTTTLGSIADAGGPRRPHPEHDVPEEIQEAWIRRTQSRAGSGRGSPRQSGGFKRRNSREISPRTSSLASMPPPRDGDVDLTRQRQHRRPQRSSRHSRSSNGGGGGGGVYQHNHSGNRHQHRRKSSNYRPQQQQQQHRSPPESPSNGSNGSGEKMLSAGSAPQTCSPLLNGPNGMVPHPKLRSSPSLDSIKNRDRLFGSGAHPPHGGMDGFGVPHHRVSKSAEYEMDHLGAEASNSKSNRKHFWEHNGAPSKVDHRRAPARLYHTPAHHDPVKLAEGLGLPPSPYEDYSPRHSHSRQSPRRLSPRNSSASNRSPRNSFGAPAAAGSGIGPASHDFAPSRLRSKFAVPQPPPDAERDQASPIERPNAPQPNSPRIQRKHRHPPQSQPGLRSAHHHHHDYSAHSHSHRDHTERPSAPGPTLSVARPVFHNGARSQPQSQNHSHQSPPSASRSRELTPRSSDSRASKEAAMAFHRLNSEPYDPTMHPRDSSRSPRNQSSQGTPRRSAFSRKRASGDSARAMSPNDSRKASSQPNTPRSSIFASAGGAPTRPAAPFALNGPVSMPRELGSAASRSSKLSFGRRRSSRSPTDTSGRRPPRPAQQRQRQQEHEQQQAAAVAAAVASPAVVRPRTMNQRRGLTPQRSSNGRAAAYHNRSLPENLHLQNMLTDGAGLSVPTDAPSPFPSGVVNAMARFANPLGRGPSASSTSAPRSGSGGLERARTSDGNGARHGASRRSFERVAGRRGLVNNAGSRPLMPRTPFVNVNSRVNHVYDHPEVHYSGENRENNAVRANGIDLSESRMKHRRSLSVPNLRRDDFGTPLPADMAALAPPAHLRSSDAGASVGAAAVASGSGGSQQRVTRSGSGASRSRDSPRTAAGRTESSESGAKSSGGASSEAAPAVSRGAKVSNPRRDREQLMRAVNSGGNSHVPRTQAALLFENAIRSMSDEEAASYAYREQNNKPGLVKKWMNKLRFGTAS